MSEKARAIIFIDKGVKGEPLTLYRHSMRRPMLCVDIVDVCKAYESMSRRMLNHETESGKESLEGTIRKRLAL